MGIIDTRRVIVAIVFETRDGVKQRRATSGTRCTCSDYFFASCTLRRSAKNSGYRLRPAAHVAAYLQSYSVLNTGDIRAELQFIFFHSLPSQGRYLSAAPLGRGIWVSW